MIGNSRGWRRKRSYFCRDEAFGRVGFDKLFCDLALVCHHSVTITHNQRVDEVHVSTVVIQDAVKIVLDERVTKGT